MVTCSIHSLIYSFIISDFDIALVSDHSYFLTPLIFKIGGLWGNHEGSMLLWLWFMAAYMFIGALLFESFIVRSLVNYYFTLTLSILFYGFSMFIILLSSPFLKSNSLSFEGTELNPILQDPGLVIHPPLVYLGYLGYILVFSTIISIVLSGKFISIYSSLLSLFNIVSWCSLTLGITLGSW